MHQPTVGRVVHYQSYGTPGGEFPSVPRAAVVTQVHTSECVDLCVMNPTGLFFNTSVRYCEVPTPGCWNWPPRT